MILDDQRLLQSSNLTTEQFIINVINRIYKTLQDPQCNNENHEYIAFIDKLLDEFLSLLTSSLYRQKTNEEIFEHMKDILLEPSLYIESLIGIPRYERKH